jgi:Asp-tRNA(Asn)/Glu-tRNA(Gln) amidotransferase A subunit family amidase
LQDLLIIPAMRQSKTLTASLFLLVLAVLNPARGQQTNTNRITTDDVVAMEKVLGLSFADDKNATLARTLGAQLQLLEQIRKFPLSNSVPSALLFNPIPVGFKFETERKEMKLSPATEVKLPANMNDLAFYSVRDLGELIRMKQLTSEKLTLLYLERLKKYGPKLLAVVTLTEDLALEQAKAADREIAAGKYKGPLHGIPYGAKDLLATKGIRTTWGSPPYTNQVFDEDATVIKRLREAGAVLVAKLALGELAMGDRWFAGQTKNPWNPTQGSGGSSAGPGAATSAGLVAFAIGTETRGSIVDPSTKGGLSALRPTYGRVSRLGAMTLSASNDKIGAMCRTVEDCAIVFSAIYGQDGVDQTLYDAPFNYDAGVKLTDLRIGYLQTDMESERGLGKSNDLAVISKLEALGAKLTPVQLPRFQAQALNVILEVEAASVFDELTLSGKVDEMAVQETWGWPNTFRRAQFVPAVDFINANRIRYQLIQEMAKMFKDIDVFVSPSFAGQCNFLSNQTGYPCVVVPNGMAANGVPTSISFIGNLFGEAKALELAKIYQDATEHHKKHPDLTKLAAP